MAKRNRSFRPSFWPEDEQDPFDVQLYEMLRQGPYALLEHTVIIHMEALGYRVPLGLGLWDGLIEGFRDGILDIKDEPTVSPARLNALEERHGQRFSPDTYWQVYVYVYAFGLEDAQWVRERVRRIGRRPPPRLSELLRALYNQRVSRSDYEGDGLLIPLFNKRLSEIEEFVQELLQNNRG